MTPPTFVASAGGAPNTAHNAEKDPTTMTPDEWDIAACRYHPKELWFPETGNHNTSFNRARKICATCPIQQQCLQAGQTEIWGMWGGLTPAERGFGRSTHTAPMSTSRIAALLEHHNQPMTVQQVHQHMNPHYTKNAARNALARLTEGGIITRTSNTPPTPDTYQWNHHT